MADRRGADRQGAIGDGFGESFIDLGQFENFRCPDGRTRVLKRNIVGMHETKLRESQIADGAGSGADVERIARINENDAKVGELFGRKHAWVFYGRIREMMDSA